MHMSLKEASSVSNHVDVTENFQSIFLREVAVRSNMNRECFKEKSYVGVYKECT